MFYKKFSSFFDKFFSNFLISYYKFKNLLQTNYDLGVFHFEKGNIKDAILRFRLVTFIDKNNIDAWYMLGRSYYIMLNKAKAKNAFNQAIFLKPSFEEAKYLLDLIEERYDLIGNIPFEIIKDYYNKYNHKKLESDLNLISHIDKIFNFAKNSKNMLELGFGCGQTGLIIKNQNHNIEITGIEISKTAISNLKKNTENKIIYNNLIEINFYDYLKCNLIKYDIICAFDSLSFVKNLDQIIELVTKSMHENSIFGFTIEESITEDNMLNYTKTYFTYTKKYITSILKSFDLKIVYLEEFTKNNNKKILYLCVLKS